VALHSSLIATAPVLDHPSDLEPLQTETTDKGSKEKAAKPANVTKGKKNKLVGTVSSTQPSQPRMSLRSASKASTPPSSVPDTEVVESPSAAPSFSPCIALPNLAPSPFQSDITIPSEP